MESEEKVLQQWQIFLDLVEVLWDTLNNDTCVYNHVFEEYNNLVKTFLEYIVRFNISDNDINWYFNCISMMHQEFHNLVNTKESCTLLVHYEDIIDDKDYKSTVKNWYNTRKLQTQVNDSNIKKITLTKREDSFTIHASWKKDTIYVDSVENLFPLIKEYFEDLDNFSKNDFFSSPECMPRVEWDKLNPGAASYGTESNIR